MRKCSLNAVNEVFAEIAKAAKLYLPVDQADGSAAFKEWENGVTWSSALNTVKSPKDLFFPQTEDLMAFKTEGKSIEVIDTRREVEDFVVFGVRACDVKSFEILDRVFIKEPVDSYYASKREKGVIVAHRYSDLVKVYTTWSHGYTEPDEVYDTSDIPKTQRFGENVMAFLEGKCELEEMLGVDINLAVAAALDAGRRSADEGTWVETGL